MGQLIRSDIPSCHSSASEGPDASVKATDLVFTTRVRHKTDTFTRNVQQTGEESFVYPVLILYLLTTDPFAVLSLADIGHLTL